MGDMSEEADRMLDLLRRSFPATHDLIAGIGADQWDGSTPCEQMTVLGVVQHLVGGLGMFEDVAAGRQVDLTTQPEFRPSDAVAAFDAAGREVLATWSAPGVADRTYAMPWGDTPGVALLGFSLIETVTHGWDLARATGQEPGFDEDVVQATLELAQTYDDETIRVPGMFGPAVEVRADAPTIDRLAGFLGRTP